MTLQISILVLKCQFTYDKITLSKIYGVRNIMGFKAKMFYERDPFDNETRYNIEFYGMKNILHDMEYYVSYIIDGSYWALDGEINLIIDKYTELKTAVKTMDAKIDEFKKECPLYMFTKNGRRSLADLKSDRDEKAIEFDKIDKLMHNLRDAQLIEVGDNHDKFHAVRVAMLLKELGFEKTDSTYSESRKHKEVTYQLNGDENLMFAKLGKKFKDKVDSNKERVAEFAEDPNIAPYVNNLKIVNHLFDIKKTNFDEFVRRNTDKERSR